VITDTREVTDTAAADEHDRVLLQVVALTRDVSSNFDAVDKANTGDRKSVV